MSESNAATEAADATAELAHYADKYRDVSITEQFDLLLVYAKALAAETANTSITNSEIEWLYRSVRDRLTIAAAPPSGYMCVPRELANRVIRAMGLRDDTWDDDAQAAYREFAERERDRFRDDLERQHRAKGTA